MDLIPSFAIDHMKLLPGVYVSRVDAVGEDFVTTFDIRMKRPNREPAVHPNALHTLEHLVATFLRNDPEWKDRIVYWGPMGCLTGNYLLVKGRPSPEEIAPLLIRAFKSVVSWEGPVPGARPRECGNAILHDLAMAKWEAARYVKVLEENPCFGYPQ
ncbi:MAG: S-ribosylhomocysteine lyase [Kiritimatiellae bacterium]|nr:S-ribosylhomocysteine lyase [Kiritimatiellia bacterium]